jgi:hypothetical protein
MATKPEFPWLTKHRIAKPCQMKWEEMNGDEKSRFCGKCRLNVYNLSALSAPEAEALLARTSGRICTTFYVRADGSALTEDCPVGLRETWLKRGWLAALAYCLTLAWAGAGVVVAAESGPQVAGGLQPPPVRMSGAPPALSTGRPGNPEPLANPKPAANPKPVKRMLGKRLPSQQ